MVRSALCITTARPVAFIGDEIASCAPVQFRKEQIMTARRRLTQSKPLDERLADEAKRLREEAKSLPPGIDRDHAIRKARQAETGLQMNDWLKSPGLQPPK
jgi:hypothetical protein